MKKYKIIFERDKCIGCGSCVAACPDNWQLQDDGKSMPKKTEITEEEYECNKEASEVCPVQIIHIEEIKEESKEENNLS